MNQLSQRRTAVELDVSLMRIMMQYAMPPLKATMCVIKRLPSLIISGYHSVHCSLQRGCVRNTAHQLHYVGMSKAALQRYLSLNLAPGEMRQADFGIQLHGHSGP